ncbi:UDP-glucuronic acid decarboxylase family protein [Mesorhizobium sp. WSM2239]|uniref:UDP-glucuronic acid decarboxylase family protein n=2 Tax=unclassified Mesorhizobium TaxID=325217 RepID=A0AAU8DI77_9HYPH
MVKRILVTGGAGFIGSHLCRALLQRGNAVLCADNLFSGFHENIEDLLRISGFAFIRHDVISPLDVEVDEIYNLACPASPVHYQADPVYTTKTNVLGLLNLLELARKLGVPLLQASTSEVYGDPHMHPQRETYLGNVNPIGIRSCYDEGKRCAESLLFDYHRKHGVRIKVARIFNTYGPRMHPNDGRVVSNFIVQALEGRDLTIYGDGSQTRSFCYVDDLVRGLIRLMSSDSSFVGPVNLGNPAEQTVLQLAESILDITGSNASIIRLPLPADDPRKRQPDIALAVKHLGWSPKISIVEGLRRTVNYFQARNSTLRRLHRETPIMPPKQTDPQRGAYV